MSGPSSSGAGPNDFVERLIAEETAALRDAAARLQAAAAAMKALPNDEQRAALQDANLAAFEALTAAAGRQAQTALADGVGAMLAALQTPAGEAPQTPPPPDPSALSDLAETLSQDRRAALEDAITRMTAAIAAATPSQRTTDPEPETKAEDPASKDPRP